MKKYIRNVTIALLILASVIGIFPRTTVAAETTNVTTPAVSQQTAQNAQSAQRIVPKKKKQVKPATICLNKSEASLEKGDSVRLRAKVKNSKTKKVIWKSSKKRVATVDKEGRVTAKDKGRTVITARISGTRIKVKAVVTVKNYVTMRVRTTGYCNCRSCAGQWAGAATASGKRPRARHTIAVDRRLIRLGTKVRIGNVTYTAEDTGGAIKGRRIDIYYASHRKATSHGVRYQNAKVFF